MTKKRYLYFDIESHNAGREFGMEPRDFFRLGQYAWDDGPVVLTEDYDEMIRVIREADYVVGHNILAFDLPALFGKDSTEPLHMAQDRKVIDTFYLAHLLTPAPDFYTDRQGHRYTDAGKPERAMKWLALDNLCFQFDLPGKFGSLKDIAKPYQPEGTKVADYDYSLIPLDDPDFRYYAEQDVVAVRGLFKYLMEQRQIQDYPGEYIWREMEAMAAIVGQMHVNGIGVNVPFAEERIREMDAKRDEVLQWLVDEYDFPTGGKAPWNSAKGKGTILKVMDDFGIRFEDNPDWPRTPKGAPKLGGDELKALCKGVSPEAEEFAEALATLKGQRTIPQLFLENMKEDGRVHPDISALQRSGRISVQRPGITVIGERSEALKRDKKLLIADEGRVLAGFDYSAADARAMAALSGDIEYTKRFDTDDEGNDLHDAHNLTGEAVFGDAYYGTTEDRGPHSRPVLRSVAKVIGHSTNYRVGAYKLAITLNAAAKEQGIDMFFWAPAGKDKDGKPRAKPITVPEEFQEYVRGDSLVAGKKLPENFILTREVLDNLDRAYPWMKMFKDKAVEEAKDNGYVTNSWGRRMRIEKGREYTGAPAMYGQSTTTEMMKDAIIRLCRKGDYYARALRCVIHDELLMEFDEATIERDIAVVRECMEVTFEPHTDLGSPIDFPVGSGYGKTWYDANH